MDPSHRFCGWRCPTGECEFDHRSRFFVAAQSGSKGLGRVEGLPCKPQLRGGSFPVVGGWGCEGGGEVGGREAGDVTLHEGMQLGVDGLQVHGSGGLARIDSRLWVVVGGRWQAVVYLAKLRFQAVDAL